MHISQIFHENLSTVFEEPQIETYAFEIVATDIDTRPLYQQCMEEIRQKICSVSEGQDRVVMSQLWEFGKKSRGGTRGAINRAPTLFPALVAHGFIVERMVDGYVVWEPYIAHLNDFWQVGIEVSNGHGFLLQPEYVFYANVRATLAMM